VRSPRCCGFTSTGALITPSRGRWPSFSTLSPSLSPQSYYALIRCGVPSRLGHHGELLAIRKRFVDRLTGGE
jgi:hypothetical protein